MIRLLGVEATRLRWRRAVLMLVAAAVVVPTIIFGATAWNTRPVSAQEQADVDRLIQRDTEQPFVQRELRRCVRNPGDYGLAEADDPQAACESAVLPQPEWYSSRSELDLVSERRGGSGVGVVVVVTMLMLLLGATFVGHDWNSGSMSNQVLFQPRRLRVWAAKGLAVLGAGLLVAGVVLTAYWTGLWLVAEQRGLAVPDGALSAAYGQALRGTLLAGAAGLGGYALTMLFRSTVATLGVLFAVAIAGPLLITLLGFPGHQRWMPQNNVGAVLLDGITYFDPDAAQCAGSSEGTPDGLAEECGGEVRMTTSDGVGYLGGLLLLAGVPSVLSFQRRDVS